jgi:gentisate 1,2-dioxygenase
MSQRAAVPGTSDRATSRARFVAVEPGFNIRRPALAPCAFLAERDAAFDATATSAVIPLDSSATLGTAGPATTPLLLACYLRIRPGDVLRTRPHATGEIHVALLGSGATTKGDDRIAWQQGDVFLLPGGIAPTIHVAGGEAPAVLYTVSDEPALRFLGAAPPLPGEAPVEATLWQAHVVRAELDGLRARELSPDTPGRAVNLSSGRTASLATCLPSMTMTYNAIPPGGRQRPHRHNAAALVLVLEPGGCCSTIDGTIIPWSGHAVLLTPAGAVHDHANEPDDPWALALIAQDGGLHYQAGTMDFAFA